MVGAEGVRRLLGPLAVELAVGRLLTGTDAAASLVPALASLLATGALPPTEAAHAMWVLRYTRDCPCF